MCTIYTSLKPVFRSNRHYPFKRLSSILFSKQIIERYNVVVSLHRKVRQVFLSAIYVIADLSPEASMMIAPIVFLERNSLWTHVYLEAVLILSPLTRTSSPRHFISAYLRNIHRRAHFSPAQICQCRHVHLLRPWL